MVCGCFEISFLNCDLPLVLWVVLVLAVACLLNLEKFEEFFHGSPVTNVQHKTKFTAVNGGDLSCANGFIILIYFHKTVKLEMVWNRYPDL